MYYMARRKIAKKPKPAAKPAKQYAAFGDVHEEAVQMLGEKYSTTELADSGDEFVIQRHLKRRSKYASADSSGYYRAVQVQMLEADEPGYFYTSSPVIGDQLDRIQGRLPGVKAHIERKRSVSGRTYLTLA